MGKRKRVKGRNKMGRSKKEEGRREKWHVRKERRERSGEGRGIRDGGRV
jgi:hypothetical protein